MLFVLINLWCALEIRRTKKYFLILFTVLFVQQIISHGNSVIDNLKDHRFDWFGVFVLTAITIIYFTWIISAIVKLQSQARAKDVG